MVHNLKEDFSFISCSIRRKDVAYAALVDDVRAEQDDEHSIPLVWHAGNWLRIDQYETLDWLITGVCVSKHPIEQGVFVGVTGQVLCAGSGDSHIEQIESGSDSPLTRGPLRDVMAIDGKAYAVGMGRQVYRRDGVNIWVAMDHSIRPQKTDSEFYGFDSIDGYSASELYAVGVYGEIWHFNGTIWRQLNSPTNLILSKVCCASDDNVYIVGQKGVIIRGRNDVWDIIPNDTFDDDIWGLAWFCGKLYVSTLNKLYTVEDDNSITVVDMGSDTATTYYHLRTADGVLWSIGRKDVMSFNGKKWTRID